MNGNHLMTGTCDTGITTIWSDFGGVLTPPIGPAMADFCTRWGTTRQNIQHAMMRVAQDMGLDDPMEAIDRPIIPESEWLRRVEEQAGIPMPTETLADDWFADRPTNTTWQQELSRLRTGGYTIGLLSNMPPTWDAHWRSMVDVDELFDHVLLSYEFGLRKPELSFFAKAELITGTCPAQNILIDDLAKNCEGARNAGWQAIHFVTAEQATKELHVLLTCRSAT